MIPGVHLTKIGNVNETVQVKQEAPLRTTTAFGDVLAKQIESGGNNPVQFSKHAALRLNDRNIQLSGEQISRVADGIGKANQKGIRDSLVLVDDVALVVNVKSRTVITAVSEMKENVFSNIDGAVIV